MKRFPVIGVLCVGAAFGLAACSDDSSPSEEATKAAAEACSDLTELRADNAKLKALDPAAATKDQVKDAYDAVREDWDGVKDNLGKLREAERSAVQAASDDLKKAYEGLPGDTTGKDALTKLQPQIQKLEETSAAAAAGLQC
ncbi:hypothetical protein AB0D66_01890 [Streptomyces sp. NPDC048270]|uniref:hypothetical protein n=1 Tax=Streptomyces sp. NPDC048270 TaxID=3154615 RepID=UPI0033D2A547